MNSSTSLLFIFATVIVVIVAPAIVDAGACTTTAEYCWSCDATTNATTTYKQNLKTLLLSLSTSTNQTNYGFPNLSMGTGTNKVNVIALCRGDVTKDNCRSCYTEVSAIVSQNCSNQPEAIIWAERCTVRYSNKTMFGNDENKPLLLLLSPESAPNPEDFKQVLNPLLETLRQNASSGDSMKKFAAGHAPVPAGSSTNQTIYATAQCSPDLNKEDCSDCLEASIKEIPTCCEGKDGARVLKPSCTLRFEKGMFYELAADSLVNVSTATPSPTAAPTPTTTPTPTATPTPPATSPPAVTQPPTVTEGSKSNKSWTVIIVVVSICASLVVLIISICICLRVRKTKEKQERKLLPGNEEIDHLETLQFDFDTIRDATDNFSDANKLGEGGFGPVYKGYLLNGEVIAVKRHSIHSGQGITEFKNEVLLVAKLQHRNLVRLLGFCLEGNEKLLVYEFVPNTSLDHIIFDPIKSAQLDWDRRYKIIVGIARGILYLHEDSRLRIIHRDLKVSNILLDAKLNPKIADFGMARLFIPDQTQGNTSRIVGTYGYMAPEYAMHGQFSVKSDVYSFGVLVLEIITGKKINSCFRHGEHVEDLLSYAWKSWKEGTAPNLIDPILKDGSRSEIIRCIHIALLCVQDNLVDRPTMNSISVMLNSYSLALALPSPPNFFMSSRTDPLAMDYSSTVIESDKSKSSSSLINASIHNDSTEIFPR